MALVKATTRRRTGGIDTTYISQLGTRGSADTRWMAKIPDGKDANGALLYKRIKRSTREEAIAARDEYLRRRKEEQAPRQLGRMDKGMTLGAWMLHWLDNDVRLALGASTYDAYKGYVQPYIVDHALGKRAMAELVQGDIERWRSELESKGVTPSVVNYALARMKTALEAAVARKNETRCQANHARKVKPLPMPEKTPYVGKPEETVAMINELRGSYMASLIQVATDLGLRRSEIAGLQWGDVDLDAGTVTLRRHLIVSGVGAARSRRLVPGTKTSKGRWQTLPLSDKSVAMLRQTQQQLLAHKLATREWKAGTETPFLIVATRMTRGGTPYIVPQHPTAPDALVWPYRNGAPWDPTTLGKWFEAVALRVGITGKSLHDMRHDCATFLIGLGVPLSVVADHMRHKNAALTAEVYVHLLKSQERLAVTTQNRLWDQHYAKAV